MKTFEFKKNVTEICSLWSNGHYGSIGVDTRLVLNRQQAITEPMMASFTDEYMRHSASMR